MSAKYSKKSYFGFFFRKIKTPSYLIANWREIDSHCVIADQLFEALLIKIVSEKPDAVFMQVGANVGTGKHDVINAIQKWNVQSVLIEPQPNAFSILRENYHGFPNVHLLNVALAVEKTTKKLFRISSYANQFHAQGKKFGNGIASFDKDHVIKFYKNHATPEGQRQDMDKVIEELDIQCTTYGEIIKDLKLSHTDILMIDTEGYDFEILKMVLETGRRPDLIRFEHKHLGKDKINAWEFLRQLSYKQVLDNKNGDTIAIKM